MGFICRQGRLSDNAYEGKGNGVPSQKQQMLLGGFCYFIRKLLVKSEIFCKMVHGNLDRNEDKSVILIAGLGNPGKQYEHTRHNMGFDTIDAISGKYQISVSERRHRALLGRGMIGEERVLLAKPQTFMNLSGESIAELVRYYKLDPPRELIVIYDDISLCPGSIRIRKKGSAGGHNGMKNIIACLGTQDFCRVKIGVGEKPQGWDLIDYVLGRFSADERGEVEEAIGHAVDAVGLLVSGEIDRAMNEYNSKKKVGA